MRTNNLLPIAKEGFKYITCAIGAFLVFSILDFAILEFISFITIIFFIFIFRNPERVISTFEEASVISPVDGTVNSIEELKDSEYAYKLEIEAKCSNIGLLRIPLSSTVDTIKIQRGARVSKKSLLFKDINENIVLTFKDTNNNSIKVEHRLKQSFKAIDLNIIKSQKVQQGTRYGFMVNGITTLYLPKNFRMNLNVGAEIKAAESLVGYFTR